MAHKTLINGTAYTINGGKDLIDGTSYAKKQGNALIVGTAMSIPFSSGITLSTTTPGEILMLNESGSLVPFYIATHDYESGLNGAGRTLLVRKDCYDKSVFNNSTNAYANSSLDSWLCNTYLKMLNTDIQSAISTTKFYYTPGDGNIHVTTLQRAVFQLSVTELGKMADYANTEGTALPIANTLQIAYGDGIKRSQWTRTPFTNNIFNAFFVNDRGGADHIRCNNAYWRRPAFTLPGTLGVEKNADGTYSIAENTK